MQIKLASKLFHDRMVAKLEFVSPGEEDVARLRIDQPGPAYIALRDLVEAMEKRGEIDPAPGNGLSEHVLLFSDVSHCDGGTFDFVSFEALQAFSRGVREIFPGMPFDEYIT